MKFSQAAKETLVNTPKPKKILKISKDIVCMSPNTGRLFATSVQLENIEGELEGTSECNPVIRSEAKKIFEEATQDLQSDIERYEDELKSATKRKLNLPESQNPTKKVAGLEKNN